MQWVIQSESFTQQRNTRPLLEAVKARNSIHVDVGIIPFEHTITGMENVAKDMPTIFYGTTLLVELVQHKRFHPGVFYEKEWFDPRYWIGKRDDYINEEQKVLTIQQLRESWVEEVTFIKPVNPKLINGQVIEPCEIDHDRWVTEHMDLASNELIVASPWARIAREWRFFIIEGNVITGSSYKRDGCLIIRDPITRETQDAAIAAAKKWLPHNTIVMDLCQLRSGEYKLLEFNCLNCSGWYNSDVLAIVDYLEFLYQ